MLGSTKRVAASAGGALAACLLLSVCAIVAWAAPAASAAEVSVREASGEPNTAELTYRAGPGEDNRLSIAISSEHGFGRLIVTDPGAAIDPGDGCADAGQGGTVVHCAMHEPKNWDYETPGKNLLVRIPGTAWSASMRIELGDGANSFDGSAFTGIYMGGVDMTVNSGDGDDRIATGGGQDTIDPGSGSDVVNGGDGFDRFFATAEPDGPDAYESGAMAGAELIYARRSSGIEVRGNGAGAPGEGDTLSGHFFLIAGSGNDVVEAGPNVNHVEGGPGNDVLSVLADRGHVYAGPGDDVLSARGNDSILVGEEGDDTYLGGAGNDTFREARAHETGSSTPLAIPSFEGGADSAYGEAGDDVIELGAGADQVWAGPGRDRVHGGDEDDQLRGGPGVDVLIGGQGTDRLWGNAGADRIFAGRWGFRIGMLGFPPVRDDAVRDQVRCGRGVDLAKVNRRDVSRGCETVRRVRPLRNPKVEYPYPQ